MEKKFTYSEVMNQYSSSLMTKYGICCVIFDGCGEHSVKYYEHRRRQKEKVSAAILVSENSHAHKDQEAFLANHQNKTQFIRLPAEHPSPLSHCVEISNAEAHTIIVAFAFWFLLQ